MNSPKPRNGKVAERPVAHRRLVTVASFRTWRDSQVRYCTGLDQKQSNAVSLGEQAIQGMMRSAKMFYIRHGLSHNRAVKEILEFLGQPVEIRRRAYRSRLSLSVFPNGSIVVSANRSLSQKAILKFLLEKKTWIQKTLDEAESFRKKYPPKRLKPGEFYPYLGEKYELHFQKATKNKIEFSDGKLTLYLTKNEWELSDEERQKYFKKLKKSYKEVAKKLMTQRIEHFSQKMGLFPRGLGFRTQKSIWGSCSPEDKISLNCKLVIAPLRVIDYVVVHELAHIQHKNHSARFWKLVDQYVDSREMSKRWLSQNQYEADFLSNQSELWL